MSQLNDNQRVLTAKLFKDSVSNGGANVYFTFGKHLPWANDLSPQLANTSIGTHFEVWNNMIGCKKITGNDISHVIPRYDWSANTVYTQYDPNNSDIGSDNTKFYIVNSAFDVYKCLYNNGEQPSTVEPTSINPSNVTQTSDGYVWKYMYSISASEKIKFTTGSYIPVKYLTTDDGSLQWDVQDNAVDGAIYGIKITNSGTGYSNVSNLIITISGDGLSAAASGNINTISGIINSITMTNYGEGYTNATVVISGGGGTGAAGEPIIGYPRGHGSNPLSELFGKNLLINPRLINTENGVLGVDNDYRQISILNNPLEYGTSTIAGNNAYSMTMDLTVTGLGASYIKDEIVYQGTSLSTSTFSGNVLEYDSANNLVKVTNTLGYPVSEPLIGAESSASKYVASIGYPDLERYSGDLLYVDNIIPITRNINQSEDFKVIIKF